MNPDETNSEGEWTGHWYDPLNQYGDVIYLAREQYCAQTLRAARNDLKRSMKRFLPRKHWSKVKWRWAPPCKVEQVSKRDDPDSARAAQIMNCGFVSWKLNAQEKREPVK